MNTESYIEQFENTDEDYDSVYIDAQGLHWNDEQSFLKEGILQLDSNVSNETIGTYANFLLAIQINFNEGNYESLIKHFGQPLTDILLSQLNNNGCLDCGITFRGSWISPKGKSILQDLINYFDFEINPIFKAAYKDN